MLYNFPNSKASVVSWTPFLGGFIIVRRLGDSLNITTVDLQKKIEGTIKESLITRVEM